MESLEVKSELEDADKSSIRKLPNDEDNFEYEREVRRNNDERKFHVGKDPGDVQRAIEGLKDMPDEELQEFLDDEDFIQGLDVVDAWEGEEEKNQAEIPEKPQPKERERDRRSSRDRSRRERRKSRSRERAGKKEEKKAREEVRRDPSKSTKDIERDKLRTKRDNESKMLAEKEKAIKNLLDSDNVVPPGTEADIIAEKQQLQQQQQQQLQQQERLSRPRRGSKEHRKSPERPGRRKSGDRGFRPSPCRRRSPLVLSPERRRSPLKPSKSPRFSMERRRSHSRRPSWERRWSPERHRRRDSRERDLRVFGRRSRSRDRLRSRSPDRHRRRYCSRSPISRRFSPKSRRSRSRSRSPLERRGRKRSPFINEIARQLAAVPQKTTPTPTSSVTQTQPPVNPQPFLPPPIPGERPPLLGLPPMYAVQEEPRHYMHPPPGGMPLPGNPGPGYGFEPQPPQLSFDPQPVYPPMYGHPNPGLLPVPGPQPVPVPPPGPLPVPAPVPPPVASVPVPVPAPAPAGTSAPSHGDLASAGMYEMRRAPDEAPGYHRDVGSPFFGRPRVQEERLKTPEPPVISKSKAFEKTSLSSLLEASVSAKDSSDLPDLYPGFKPEILRQCENALRALPVEDPRLKMKGRFFFDPREDERDKDYEECTSNSILLQNDRNKIYWKEIEQQHRSLLQKPLTNDKLFLHHKICQTDTLELSSKSVQAKPETVDCAVQVTPLDLRDEKKPIMDRLDWNMRETFDYGPSTRDLRWSLTNSSQKRGAWNVSPPALEPGAHRSSRERYSRERYSHEREDNFRLAERRTPVSGHEHEHEREHSPGSIPVILVETDDEMDVEHGFQRGSADWHSRGKTLRGGRSSPSMRLQLGGVPKFPGGSRPYRGGGGGAGGVGGRGGGFKGKY